MAKTNNKNKRKTKTVMKHSIRKPKGLYLEEHLNWKDLPLDLQAFLVQTEIADKKRHKEISKVKDIMDRNNPQYQISDVFNTFVGWWIHQATIAERQKFIEYILYTTEGRGNAMQYLVNDHNKEFKE